MTRSTIVSLVLALFLLPVIPVALPAGKVEKSPHARALELVFAQRSEEIRNLETGDWWLDSQERAWRVSRPFDAGLIDSTHWFNVEYQISGKAVGHWFVDTKKGTVESGRKLLK